MDNTTINNIPVEFSNSNEPIIEVHFMDTLDASPSVAPSKNRIKTISNFSGPSFNRSDLVALITENLPLYPTTQKVVVMFCKP